MIQIENPEFCTLPKNDTEDVLTFVVSTLMHLQLMDWWTDGLVDWWTVLRTSGSWYFRKDSELGWRLSARYSEN